MPTSPDTEYRNYQLLAQFLRGLVAERYKRMAKEDVLFKFMSASVEPAVLVDFHAQTEKMAVDLSEMNVLEIVEEQRVQSELSKLAQKIQGRFQEICGERLSQELASPKLVSLRKDWLRARMAFYSSWLSLKDSTSDPLTWAVKVFPSMKLFQEKVQESIASDRLLNEEILRVIDPMHRFMMKKHLDHELKRTEEIWNEFAEEAYKTPASLT